MNTSKESPKQTRKGFSASKNRADTFAYIVGDGIYINLTNRCTNDCDFCLRNNGDTAYESNSLWLKHEPSPEAVIDAIEAIYFDGCSGFVFCGYGEPTCRFDALIETAAMIKNKYPGKSIRLNTNGQSELINGTESTLRLFGLIDCVSISMNSANAEEYDLLCHSVFGKKAYDAMIAFGKHCVGNIPKVQFSVVEETLSDEDIRICLTAAEKIGANLRVRKFISENNQNPEGK